MSDDAYREILSPIECRTISGCAFPKHQVRYFKNLGVAAHLNIKNECIVYRVNLAAVMGADAQLRGGPDRPNPKVILPNGQTA